MQKLFTPEQWEQIKEEASYRYVTIDETTNKAKVVEMKDLDDSVTPLSSNLADKSQRQFASTTGIRPSIISRDEAQDSSIVNRPIPSR